MICQFEVFHLFVIALQLEDAKDMKKSSEDAANKAIAAAAAEFVSNHQ